MRFGTELLLVLGCGSYVFPVKVHGSRNLKSFLAELQPKWINNDLIIFILELDNFTEFNLFVIRTTKSNYPS